MPPRLNWVSQTTKLQTHTSGASVIYFISMMICSFIFQWFGNDDMSMFIYNRFISGEYDTLFIFKISLSFLILEVNYRLWSRFKEVNAERNCHEIWVSIRSFFMYNIQKRSIYSKRKFAAKSSEISPLSINEAIYKRVVKRK